ncbi:MAG TPA: cation transporting ATPase C-terminal domain-containing protein [Duganella sp.]
MHLPIAGMTLLPLLAGTALVFTPIHIVFLEMVINPACSIVFAAEAPEQNIMCRPPRRVGERLFGRETAVFAVLQGLGLLAAAAALFLIGGMPTGPTTESGGSHSPASWPATWQAWW